MTELAPARTERARVPKPLAFDANTNQMRRARSTRDCLFPAVIASTLIHVSYCVDMDLKRKYPPLATLYLFQSRVGFGPLSTRVSLIFSPDHHPSANDGGQVKKVYVKN